MDKYFLQFNTDKIEQIVDFFYDTNNLLYFNAPSGSGKNESLRRALLKANDNFLIFNHYCSEFSVLEDLLLNFYDSLRNYSIAQKVQIKKSLATDFTQKVTDYLKTLPKKSIVIIDNFEKVMNNAEITQFLSRLLQNPNIKIILLSKTSLELWSFKNAFTRYKVIDIQTNTKEVFKNKTQMVIEDITEDEIDKLYGITQGKELWLRMSLAYLAATEIRPNELFNEFQKNKSEYGDFIISRTMTLVPATYSDFIKIMSLTHFLVSKNLIINYKIGDLSQIDYLVKRLVVCSLWQGYYLPDHIKQYFAKNLTIGEKIKFGTQLADIFNEEIAKSPKDRIIRLSREGIEKQIEFIKQNTPKLNDNVPNSASVDFISHAQNTIAPWYMKDMPKIAEEKTINPKDNILLKKFREGEFKKNSLVEMIKKSDKVTAMFDEVRRYRDEKNYDKAIEVLKDFSLKNSNEALQAEIDNQIALNYIQKNNFKEALNYFYKAADYYLNSLKYEKHSEFLLKIANIYKGLKDFDNAVKNYQKIINNIDRAEENTVVKAFQSLAKIYEIKNNENEYFTTLNKLAKYAEDKENQQVIRSANYKLALLSEKNDDFKRAKEYYLKSIEVKIEDDILPYCYLNLALIFADENETINAEEYFALAIKQFTKNKETDYSGLYWANINAAHLYKRKNEDLYKKYLDDALLCAKNLDDDFEIASVLVEIGDYYYYKKDNENALFKYLKARDTLKENFDSQNMQMIFSRVDDLKARMGQAEFEKAAYKYEQKTN